MASRLAAADAANRDRTVELQLRGAELELNRLLGIDPEVQLRLVSPAAASALIPSAHVLFQAALASRTDLKGLRAAYQGSQAAIDAASLGRYPLPSLGINAARDTGNIKTIGPSVAFTLPLWNRGQGNTVVAAASQAQLRANYLARLATIRADLAAASANLEITQLQQSDISHELLGLQAQVESNYRAANRGDFSFAGANAAQITLLDKQLVHASLALASAELEIALEILVGRPLENIE